MSGFEPALYQVVVPHHYLPFPCRLQTTAFASIDDLIVYVLNRPTKEGLGVEDELVREEGDRDFYALTERK